MKFGYGFLYTTFPFSFWSFFRRLYLTNIKGIPKDKPVLLACNHPNSFMDGFLFAGAQHQSIHFIARGDAMNTPRKKWFFGLFHTIPIFRLQEGVENLHRNKETFRECQELLEKNGKIIIFSEGICVQEKRVRKLKKGTARMYFEIEANFDFNLGIEVIPIGFNYTFFNKVGAEAMINVGEPMDMEPYKKLYQTNKAQAINAFTADLQEKIKEQVITIEKVEDEELAENLLTMTRSDFNEPPLPWKSTRKDRFLLEKNTCDTVNSISMHDRSTYDVLSNAVQQYFTKLKENQLSDLDIAKDRRYGLGKGLLFLLGWPLFILGYVLNILPVWLGKTIADKVVTNSVFYLSVRAALTHFIYFFLYIPLWLLMFAWLSDTWYYGLTGLAIMAITGYFALYYPRLWKNSIFRLRYWKVKSRKPHIIKTLRKQREKILQIINGYQYKLKEIPLSQAANH